MSEEIINIEMGEFAVARSPAVLTSTGIGSCLVICLYDDSQGIGAMGHAMLPCEEENIHSSAGSAHYVDRGISKMIKEMETNGCSKDSIVAKLVGGASMFKTLTQYSRKIGEDNIETARKIFKELGIVILAESTGGTVGRSVQFNVMNGVVTVILKI